MSREMLRLVESPSATDSRQWRDGLASFRCWLASGTVDRVPFVMTRRATIEARELTAFKLGVEAGRAGYRLRARRG